MVQNRQKVKAFENTNVGIVFLFILFIISRILLIYEKIDLKKSQKVKGLT